MLEGSGDYFLTFGVVSFRSHATHCPSMSVRGDIASTSVTGKGQKRARTGASVGRTCSKRPTELISKWEFWELFAFRTTSLYAW